MFARTWRPLSWALLASLCACGLEVVELAGRNDEEGATILVLGAIPKQVVDRFASSKGEVVEPMQLGLSYPANGTAIPANCAPLTFLWQEPRDKGPKPMTMTMKGDERLPAGEPKPAGSVAPSNPRMDGAKERGHAFELTLRTAMRTLRIYTDQLSVRVPEASWRSLLAERGALTIELRALAIDAPQRVLVAQRSELTVRAPWPAGAVYYRRGAGVARAAITESDDELLALADCPGRDIAMSPLGDRLGVQCPGDSALQLSLPTLRELAAHSREEGGELFGSFDPSGTRIARAYSGAIDILDASSGALLARAPLPAGGLASDASWSHDGTRIVLAYAPAGPAMDPASAGQSIAVFQVETPTVLGPPRVIVTEAGRDQTLRFPLFSPDDRFIVYTRGKVRMANIDDASLWMVPAQGGAAIALWDDPMQRDKRDAAPQPIWIVDSTQAWWLVYASQHSVGEKRESEGRQLWATWLDPSAFELQQALATPPFWLPFQELGTSNDRPQWAPAALAP